MVYRQACFTAFIYTYANAFSDVPPLKLVSWFSFKGVPQVCGVYKIGRAM